MPVISPQISDIVSKSPLISVLISLPISILYRGESYKYIYIYNYILLISKLLFSG